MVKVENAGAVGIRGHAQIRCMPQVHTHLELVIALDLRPVVRKLQAPFFLEERAVAAADIQALAQTAGASTLVALADRVLEIERGETSGGRIAGDIQADQS